MRLSIVTKITLLFTSVIAMFAAASYYQLAQMRASSHALYLVNLGHLPLSKIVTQLDAAQKNQQANVARILELSEPQARSVGTRLLSDYYPRLVRQHIVQGLAHCDKLALVTASEEGRSFFTDAREKLASIARLQEQHQTKTQQLLELLNQPEADTRTAISEIKDLEHTIDRETKVLSLKMDDALSNTFQGLESQGDRATWAGIILSAGALAAAIALATVSGFLLKPLRRLTEAAQAMGQGEYRTSISIRSGDEMGALAEEFERMRFSFIQRDRQLTRQAEELELSNRELNTLKLHYENIINNLSLPVLVADVQKRLTTVNLAARHVWGRELDDFIGRPVSDLPLAHGSLGEALNVAKVLAEKVTLRRETLKVRRTDGEERLVTFTAVPFLDGEQVKGLLILGEDVTDAVRLEDSLLKTERLAAVGRIAAKITHEVRNPLSSIALNTEMLQEELDVEKPALEAIRPLLQSIIREVERLHAITEDYLKFAKMPASKTGRLNLNRILTNLGEFYRAEMNQKGISLRLDLADEDPIVRGDENQFVQVVHNLIKNAIEAMGEGGALELKTESDAEHHRLMVRDTGPGVPETVADRIFEPFFSTKPEGTGLGLALAQQIVTDMGGRIRYLREEGYSVFLVELPVSEVISDETIDDEQVC